MKMKRLFTLVLSLMMILSLSAPASDIDGENCLVFKSTDAIMQLEVNDADYDVKMPEDFPFEETYNKAIERYGVKGPWD